MCGGGGGSGKLLAYGGEKDGSMVVGGAEGRHVRGVRGGDAGDHKYLEKTEWKYK